MRPGHFLSKKMGAGISVVTLTAQLALGSLGLGLMPTIALAATNADLSITKVASTATPAAGANVTYTITMTNNSSGSNHADNAKFTDTIPANMTYVSGAMTGGTDNSGGSCSVTSGVITCVLSGADSKLQAGKTAIFQVVMTVSGGACGASIANTATVSATGNTDAVSGNNSSISTVNVQACVADTDSDGIPA